MEQRLIHVKIIRKIEELLGHDKKTHEEKTKSMVIAKELIRCNVSSLKMIRS